MKRSTEAQARLVSVDKSELPSTILEDSNSLSFEGLDSSQNTDGDSKMPDTSDPDAGFCPTDEQPFRRVRRYTIT